MAWIELHETLPEHKKIYALMEALNIDQLKALGVVTRLWLWAIRQAGDGDLTGYPPKAIANAIGWNKSPKALFDALVSSGFIDLSGDGKCALHDWYDYAGRLVDHRAKNAERMRTSRARAKNVQNTCDARAGATVPNLTKPNRTFDDEDDTATGIHARARIQTAFKNSFGNEPTPAELDALAEWVDQGMNVDVVCEAVRRSAVANADNRLAYTLECMLNWRASGCETLEDVQAADADRDIKAGRL